MYNPTNLDVQIADRNSTGFIKKAKMISPNVLFDTLWYKGSRLARNLVFTVTSQPRKPQIQTGQICPAEPCHDLEADISGFAHNPLQGQNSKYS